MASSLPITSRAPSNTHPSRFSHNYGSTTGNDNELTRFESFESSRSFRDAVGSFAGSYSRTSMLYIAENLTIPASTHDVERRMSIDSKTSRPHYYFDAIDRTLSQRTATTTTAYQDFPDLSRHTTLASVLQPDVSEKRSSFIQSVFNAVNVLVGIGILAMPLAMRCSGWLVGSLIFLFCALGTNYTAKIIARCLDADGASTYGDMGAAAFNEGGRAFVSTVFIVELMTIGIAMVVLLGDGIQAFWPQVDLMTVRMVSFIVLTPTLFLPMRRLAFTSLIGIITCICLLFTVIANGFYKKTAPGSLLDLMDTEVIPSDPYNIPLAFGLMMAGFSGHAVFPAIYRDMQDPKQYERMVDITYVITGVAYITMAATGYFMFGSETMQEITQNLASTPGFHRTLTRLGVGLIVLTPVAKYGLMLNPVNLTWELWILGQPAVEAWCKFQVWRKRLVSASVRIITSLVIVYIATVFPGFDRVVSLLGALFSFGISAIFPLICYQRLFGDSISLGESILNNFILTVSILMAVLGTIWSFLPNSI